MASWAPEAWSCPSSPAHAKHAGGGGGRSWPLGQRRPEGASIGPISPNMSRWKILPNRSLRERYAITGFHWRAPTIGQLNKETTWPLRGQRARQQRATCGLRQMQQRQAGHHGGNHRTLREESLEIQRIAKAYVHIGKACAKRSEKTCLPLDGEDAIAARPLDQGGGDGAGARAQLDHQAGTGKIELGGDGVRQHGAGWGGRGDAFGIGDQATQEGAIA